MGQESSFTDITRSSGVFEDFLRGENLSGDPTLDSGANVDIGKLSSDVDALRQVGSGLDASGAVGQIIERFKNFNSGGDAAFTDPEVSLSTESNLLQQSNTLKAIQQQAALLGPGATSSLGQTSAEALTKFGIERSNIPTNIRDKFFAQFTPLLQASLGAEIGTKQATIGAEQSVQGFDLGISNQALSNALNFGPIEAGKFGQQKELSNIAAAAQVNAAKAANQADKAGPIAGGVGQIAGSLILASALSDFRLKDQVDFIDEKDALEIIQKIHGFRWDWKDGSGSAMGVIAQEVQKVFPEAVVADPVSGMLMVNYSALVGLLIAATGAIQKRIKKIEKTLEGK